MNIDIMKQLGFNKEIELIKKGCCAFCTKEINNLNGYDELSIKEYKISGLCLSCQNEVFK